MACTTKQFAATCATSHSPCRSSARACTVTCTLARNGPGGLGTRASTNAAPSTCSLWWRRSCALLSDCAATSLADNCGQGRARRLCPPMCRRFKPHLCHSMQTWHSMARHGMVWPPLPPSPHASLTGGVGRGGLFLRYVPPSPHAPLAGGVRRGGLFCVTHAALCPCRRHGVACCSN